MEKIYKPNYSFLFKYYALLLLLCIITLFPINLKIKIIAIFLLPLPFLMFTLSSKRIVKVSINDKEVIIYYSILFFIRWSKIVLIKDATFDIQELPVSRLFIRSTALVITNLKEKIAITVYLSGWTEAKLNSIYNNCITNKKNLEYHQKEYFQ